MGRAVRRSREIAALDTTKRKTRPTRVGVVESDKGDRTIRVVMHRLAKHPLYGKYLRRRTVLYAHDENNEAHQGDRVEVMFTRRYSKTKCWRLVRILERSPEHQ